MHMMRLFKKVFIYVLASMSRFSVCASRAIHSRGIAQICRYAIWKGRLKYLGDDVVFYRGIVIHGPGEVSIGQGTRIADYVHMWGGGSIEIGANVLIAAHSVITSITHDTQACVFAQSAVREKVRIHNNVWIGSSAVILPGVTVGENAIIGAGAVVTRDVAPSEIVVGVPARSANPS